MNFTAFKLAINTQFTKMQEGTLFVSSATKDELWYTYINRFPEGTNPIFRKRTEHDCNCCKQFIRAAGNVLSIVDGELVSIWDVKLEDEAYQAVANALSALVKSRGISSVFLHSEGAVGTDQNNDNNVDIVWKHFHQVLPRNVVVTDGSIGTKKGSAMSNFAVLKRSVEEISFDAIETVLGLINDNAIYKGTEFKSIVTKLHNIKSEITELKDHELFLWEQSIKLGHSGGIRNTVIGTLLVDISNGEELEVAVKKYESKVAPENYKRTSALVTAGMIKQAEAKVEELGIESALHRRHAVTSDVTINNVLFADRSVKPSMGGVFGEMKAEAASKPVNVDNVQEVNIDDFISNIIPEAKTLELMMDNAHTSNLMSLVAPVNIDAESILKWDNNFTWSYNGEVTDSIKERVKTAGGKVDGDLRVSLAWFNPDDLDIHIHTPVGTIYYGDRRLAGAKLDVDMNNEKHDHHNPVENVTWANKRDITEGVYEVRVHNFSKRLRDREGFVVELEFGGKITTFSYNKIVGQDERVGVVKFSYSHANGVEILKSIPSTETSKNVWGVDTCKFQKVNMMMLSPNHWDGQAELGNKHYFFILDNCTNPDKVRGFYNEFLRGDLNEHRKVFEVLSSKMKPCHSDEQLSGLGFSSTRRNSVLCRVTNDRKQVFKINF